MADFPRCFPLTSPLESRIVGRKAARLSNALINGYPVEPGFVLVPGELTSEGLIEFVSEDYRGIATVGAILDEIQGDSLAIRSSAVEEDGLGTSFAGMFKSVLNVERSVEAVIAACEVVRGSANSAVVQHYRTVAGLASTDMMPNVILQRFISADTSGTAVTNIAWRGGEIVLIEAGYGAAAVVDGLDVASTVLVGRDTLHLVGFGVEGQFGSQSFLIAELAISLAERNRAPVEIEWCFTDGQLKLNQWRPSRPFALPSNLEINLGKPWSYLR